MPVQFALVSTGSAMQHRPPGVAPWASERPAEFTVVLSEPVGATLGEATADVTILASSDPCAAIDLGSAPLETAAADVNEFTGSVTFDWGAGYRVLEVSAPFTADGQFGYLDFSFTIQHANLPPDGEHCGEVRIELTHPTNQWIYSDLEVDSDPAAQGTPNPLYTTTLGTTELDIAVRFHVTDGVLTLVSAGTT